MNNATVDQSPSHNPPDRMGASDKQPPTIRNNYGAQQSNGTQQHPSSNLNALSQYYMTLSPINTVAPGFLGQGHNPYASSFGGGAGMATDFSSPYTSPPTLFGDQQQQPTGLFNFGIGQQEQQSNPYANIVQQPTIGSTNTDTLNSGINSGIGGFGGGFGGMGILPFLFI